MWRRRKVLGSQRVWVGMESNFLFIWLVCWNDGRRESIDFFVCRFIWDRVW